jgi:hemerythrin-like domain-containing protein
MSRFDVLGPAHKGLRNGLGKLQFKAGSMNFSDLSQVSDLLSDLKSMWQILDAHANGEDKFLYPMLEKINDVVFQILEEEHSGLMKVEKNIENELITIHSESDSTKREALGSIFVKNLNDYIAHYYIHLQTEELKAIPELWKSYEDFELMQALSKFATVTPPEVGMKFIEFMMPALNTKERIGFMMNIKKNTPEVVYKNYMQATEKILSQNDFKSVQNALK